MSRRIVAALLTSTLFGCSEQSDQSAAVPAAAAPAQSQASAQPPKVTAPENGSASNDGELTPKEIIRLAERAVVLVRADDSLGSGFLIDRNLVVTNEHVIEGGNGLTVRYVDGTEQAVAAADVVLRDSAFDLALIRVEPPPDAAPLTLGTLPEKGDRIWAIGHPRGLDFTVSDGIVSAVRDGEELGLADGTWVQVTAPINPGNSGGPLLDSRGRVVGINTLRLGFNDGLAFALSAPDISIAVARRDNDAERWPTETTPESASATPEIVSADIGIPETRTYHHGHKIVASHDEFDGVSATYLTLEPVFLDENTGILLLFFGRVKNGLPEVLVAVSRVGREYEPLREGDKAIRFLAHLREGGRRVIDLTAEVADRDAIFRSLESGLLFSETAVAQLPLADAVILASDPGVPLVRISGMDVELPEDFTEALQDLLSRFDEGVFEAGRQRLVLTRAEFPKSAVFAKYEAAEIERAKAEAEENRYREELARRIETLAPAVQEIAKALPVRMKMAEDFRGALWLAKSDNGDAEVEVRPEAESLSIHATFDYRSESFSPDHGDTIRGLFDTYDPLTADEAMRKLFRGSASHLALPPADGTVLIVGTTRYEISRVSPTAIRLTLRPASKVEVLAEQEKAAEVKWNLAMQLRRRNRESVAKQYLKEIIENFPDTKTAEKARKLIE